MSRRLFVYGTLKRGGPREGILQEMGAQYIGNDVVRNFTLRVHVSGQFPAAVPWPEGVVTGELWALPETCSYGDGTYGNCLTLLDRIEGAPCAYRRMEIVTHDGERAIMYVWSGPSSLLGRWLGARWNNAS